MASANQTIFNPKNCPAGCIDGRAVHYRDGSDCGECGTCAGVGSVESSCKTCDDGEPIDERGYCRACLVEQGESARFAAGVSEDDERGPRGLR